MHFPLPLSHCWTLRQDSLPSPVPGTLKHGWPFIQIRTSSKAGLLGSSLLKEELFCFWRLPLSFQLSITQVLNPSSRGLNPHRTSCIKKGCEIAVGPRLNPVMCNGKDIHDTRLMQFYDFMIDANGHFKSVKVHLWNSASFYFYLSLSWDWASLWDTVSVRQIKKELNWT